MAVGLITTFLANRWLDTVGGTAFTTIAGSFIKLHLGDPGAAAATNPSTNTTRVSATWGAAAAGSKAISNTPTWAAWANGNETISHISDWDAITAGNAVFTAALTVSKAVTNGDTLTLATLTFALTPLAA
jgi:hypothetical protein